MAASGEVEKQDRLASRWTKIAGVVTLYWFVSISMVFLNKYLLSSPDLKLGAPLFITLSQCVVAVLCFVLLSVLSRQLPHALSFPPFEFDPCGQLRTALKVLPLSLLFVGMIVFNNLTLKHLGIAFYNVGRSLTTVFNVSFSFLILGQRISCAIITCCSVIVFGFLFGLKEEEESSVGDISVKGVVCGILASFCVALYAIFTKKVLPTVGDNIWKLQFYNNFNAVLLMSPLVFVFGEVPVLWEFPYWGRLYFWALILVVGVFGISIGYVTALQIQVTSPLTHNVSGTAKACAQTVLACVVYSETKPFWWWVSNFMVLGGSSAYTYVRMMEMKAEKHKQTSPELVVENGEDNDG